MSACDCGKPNNHCDPCSTEMRSADQRTCACVSSDARECIDLRYRRGRVGFVCDLDGIDEECECFCHDRDEWDMDEGDYDNA